MCVTVKSAISRFGHVYDVLVTSCVGYLYLFWYVWYQLDISGGPVFKITGGGNRVTEKGLVRMLNITNNIVTSEIAIPTSSVYIFFFLR